jgi:hypothetical protein
MILHFIFCRVEVYVIIIFIEPKLSPLLNCKCHSFATVTIMFQQSIQFDVIQQHSESYIHVNVVFSLLAHTGGPGFDKISFYSKFMKNWLTSCTLISLIWRLFWSLSMVTWRKCNCWQTTVFQLNISHQRPVYSLGDITD